MQATAVTSPAKPSEPCSTTAATEFSVSSFVKGDLEARPSPAGYVRRPVSKAPSPQVTRLARVTAVQQRPLLGHISNALLRRQRFRDALEQLTAGLPATSSADCAPNGAHVAQLRGPFCGQALADQRVVSSTSFYRPRMCLNGEEGRSKVEVVVAQCFRPLPKDDSPATYLTGMRVTHLGEEPQVGPWTAEGHLIDKAGCVAYLRDNADALMQGRITEKKGITAHKLLLERGNHHEALRTYFTLVVEETLGPLVEKKKGSLLPVVGRERSPMEPCQQPQLGQQLAGLDISAASDVDGSMKINKGEHPGPPTHFSPLSAHRPSSLQLPSYGISQTADGSIQGLAPAATASSSVEGEVSTDYDQYFPDGLPEGPDELDWDHPLNDWNPDSY
ncbi:hypothetical protein WJX74_008233 [Apatococcus lobatus]|uniref:Uncharacterized protein n=1 Tax=Apatococcus lobatus TaxID=904363 RepID=A0AAW1RRJ3_9CHLO